LISIADPNRNQPSEIILKKMILSGSNKFPLQRIPDTTDARPRALIADNRE
jgi:hypothetical protein